MRWLLLFIALAIPVALASPSFWSLFAMEFGAAPVTYHYHDGTSQQALLGPRAPWPDWAIVPDGTRLQVGAWFGPSSKEPETGHGDLSVEAEPRTVAAAYVERLKAEGWQVEANIYRYPQPVLQPKLMEICIVRATREGGDLRILQASFDLAPRSGSGGLAWSMRPRPLWEMSNSEPC